MKTIDEIKELITQELIDADYGKMNINYILTKNNRNNSESMILANATDIVDSEVSVDILINKNCVYMNGVHEWQYNYDEDLLEILENGFEIVYMPLQTHYNVWCALDNSRDEINHPEGLQKYLSYCFVNGITSKAINALGYKEVNIMDMYEERNGNYKIIAEISIGYEGVVLAYNPKNPNPYVTWATANDRHWGYVSGHYFGNVTSAFKDFEERCKGMFEGAMERKRIDVKTRKEKRHER